MKIMEAKKAYLAVILIQSIYAGMFLLSKAAFDLGMNTFVFVFYRQAASAVFLIPLAAAFEWKNAPPLSFVTLCKIFFLSLFGITFSLNIYGVALIYTSASLAAATTNCIPIITFFIALLFGMEMVRLRTSGGIAKVAGLAICLVGVTTIAFYRGPTLKLLLHHHLLGSYHNTIQHHGQVASNSHTTWIKGCFLMLMANIFWGLWLVLQVPVIKSYPSKLVLTALQCLFSAIQSFLIAVALERDPNQWRLEWNVRLLAVVYCGVVVTGVTFYLQAWVIEKKGPVFLAMSQPLAFAFTIFCSAFLFGETISLGSVLGATVLVGGLYSVLWGKNREHKIPHFSLSWLKPILVMIVAQIITVANNIFYKLAIIDSMPSSILVAYRFIFGTLSLAPFALYYSRTKPTWKQAYLSFVYGLLGLETLAYGTCAGKIKLVGITLSIGGVMLLAFFKRVEININVSPTKFSLLPQHYQRTRDHNDDQVLGLVLAIIAAFSSACFLTIQAKFKDDTQNIYLIPFMMNLMGAIQGVVYALGVESDWEQWKLGWNISVAAIVLIIAATLLVLYGKLKEMDYQLEGSGSEENEDEDLVD
ncbi:hypothetical protein RHMOL_Rhmol08G0005200 [Rhododendron molle]|uniref:Uncharacterized protein n=1 Tax=Rhododendron molle TaxID=49168 RepID=A0ACC0MI86_RHOML|nr:hypothetical protein RHMOL_Rhmol08G0005200 [Rhododendron molle]